MLNSVRSAWTFLGVSTIPSEASVGVTEALPEVLLTGALGISRSAGSQIVNMRSMLLVLVHL